MVEEVSLIEARRLALVRTGLAKGTGVAREGGGAAAADEGVAREGGGAAAADEGVAREGGGAAAADEGVAREDGGAAAAGAPGNGGGSAPRSVEARALAAIRRTGYLQLDTVSIAGARSHSIVLLSRIPRLDPRVGESLLRPGTPLFEYWGHEVSWIPIELYPEFEFRRKEFRRHPWWGDILGEHRDLARDLLRRIRDEGPVRSADLEGPGSRGWWGHKPAKRVLEALWSSGEVAIRERRNFLRTYDLAERVIPEPWRSKVVSPEESLRRLFLLALAGHGWATTGTLATTWRLRNRPNEIAAALRSLEEDGRVIRCALVAGEGRRVAGWIRPADLDLAAKLRRSRPRADRGVLLSPFDPLLWDRARVRTLFGFDQILEIYKPKPRRKYGYYCLPVLAGERLVARVDLKADRKSGAIHVLSLRYEGPRADRPARPEDRTAAFGAVHRFAAALGLAPRREGRALPRLDEFD